MGDLSFLRRWAERLERIQLRRWYSQRRLLARRLDLKLDLSQGPGLARVTADLTFVPAVAGATTTLILGDVKVQSVHWGDKAVKARVNAPYLVLSFPRHLPKDVEQRIVLRYSYVPDEQYTLLQPVTPADCPMRVTITCRRPFLGLTQGKLLEGKEDPPLRIYQWDPPRCRRLTALVANVKSYRKETPSGMSMWLHVQADETALAAHVLDLCVQLYEESAESHHVKLPYSDFHVLECDDPRMKPFNSPGLVVVPRGTFRQDDRPYVYGVLAPEFNKEWRRDRTRMVSEGRKD